MTGPPRGAFLEAVLIAALCAAVIAFGGTQQLVWAAVKLVIFLCTAAAIWILPQQLAALPWRWLALLGVFLLAQAFVLRAGGERVNEPLVDFLVYPAAFALAAALAASPAARGRLAAALIALGLAEALYGLTQSLAGWQQILGIEKIFYRSQATGTYVNPNHFSGLLEMALPLALATAAWHWGRAELRHERAARNDGRAVAAFLVTIALLIAAGIFESRSRMGILSAMAGVALTGGAWTCAPEGHRRKVRASAVTGVLAAAALLALWMGPEAMVERFRAAAKDYHTRIDLWRESAALVRARPLFGAGWGAFPHLYPQVQATQLEFAVEHAHNDYLELATEFGIPGAALLVTLAAGVALRACLPVWRGVEDRAAYQALGAASGIAALGVHSVADFNLRLPANALIFSALLGLAWAAATPPPGAARAPAIDAIRFSAPAKESRT